jgi:hypothetical protein
MLRRQFDPWTFMHVRTFDPDRNPEGTVSEFMPQARYAKANTTRVNPHDGGPFCRFVVPDAPHRVGVYVLTADDKVMYIGKAQDLAERWGCAGTGRSNPRTVTPAPSRGVGRHPWAGEADCLAWTLRLSMISGC